MFSGLEDRMRKTEKPEGETFSHGMVRVSLGSAILLGLMRGRLDAEPTTIYLLTYRRGRCTANCGFCPQARGCTGRADMLSRVVWPPFPAANVIERIGKAYIDGRVKRVCIQALNHPDILEEIISLVRMIRLTSSVPISVSCQPLQKEEMVRLRETGVNRVSIALDASTRDIFNEVKGTSAGGPYTWDGHMRALKDAVEVFGEGSVTTHLIVGLGESEEEAVRTIQLCHDMGVYPALFAFTPIPGTRMAKRPSPPLEKYRRIQVAQYLITHNLARYADMTFEEGRLRDFGVPRNLLLKIVESGRPFMTTGCPGCNRPYYNERPGGPLYNYPRKPKLEEVTEIKRQLGLQ